MYRKEGREVGITDIQNTHRLAARAEIVEVEGEDLRLKSSLHGGLDRVVRNLEGALQALEGLLGVPALEGERERERERERSSAVSLSRKNERGRRRGTKKE